MPLISLSAQAEFVTDKIVIEVRSQRLSQGAILKTLPSGSDVEVLMRDGDYARIRTNDNITGWVQSQFLTKDQPTQNVYLELLAKYNTLETKLKAAEANQGGGDGIDIAEIEELRKRAADAGWMRVELKKARDRNNELENKIKTSGQPGNSSQKELAILNDKNKELERRLAAAMEYNEQQQQLAIEEGVTASVSASQTSDEQDWAVNIEWFLGSIVVALIIGLIGGMTWLDNRIRQRHGGFRIY
jgi:uncharacterized protein YgiM (DUF1202 family)